eukprot:7515305-Prorocentrum_lima.AAC.1
MQQPQQQQEPHRHPRTTTNFVRVARLVLAVALLLFGGSPTISRSFAEGGERARSKIGDNGMDGVQSAGRKKIQQQLEEDSEEYWRKLH